MVTIAPSAANMKAPLSVARHPVKLPPSTVVLLRLSESERDVSGRRRMFAKHARGHRGRVGKKTGIAGG